MSAYCQESEPELNIKCLRELHLKLSQRILSIHKPVEVFSAISFVTDSAGNP